MENEREFNIPLDSNLDINMNDMLVSVEQPTFKHNRQRMLGGLLQTSVRYEDDGYFAGWWRHQFVLVNTGLNIIEPSLSDNINSLIIYNRLTDKGVPFYIIQDRDAGLKISFSPQDWLNTLTGTANITRLSDTDRLRVTGKTQRGLDYNVTIDIYTGELIDSVLPPGFYANTYLKNNAICLYIDRELIAQNDYFLFRKNYSLYINNNLLSYEADSKYSYWGKTLRKPSGEFRLEHINNKVTAPTNSEFSIDSYTTHNENKATEFVRTRYKNNTEAKINCNIDYTELWTSLRFNNADVAAKTIGGSSGSEPMNTQKVSILDIRNNDKHNPEIDIAYAIPVWIKHAIEQIDFSVYVKHSYSDKKLYWGINCSSSAEQLSQIARGNISAPALFKNTCYTQKNIIRNESGFSNKFKVQVGSYTEKETVIKIPYKPWYGFGLVWDYKTYKYSYVDKIKYNTFVTDFKKCSTLDTMENDYGTIRLRVLSNNFYTVPDGEEIFAISFRFKLPEEARSIIENKNISIDDLKDICDIFWFLDSVIIESQSYEYYEVLNKVDIINDRSLFKYLRDLDAPNTYLINSSDTNNFVPTVLVSKRYSITVPHCIYAYTFNTLKISNILKSDKTAATISVKAAQTATTSIPHRLDVSSNSIFADTNTGPLLKAMIENVSLDTSENDINFLISMNSNNQEYPFYVNQQTSSADIVQSAYPAWIISDNMTTSTNTVSPYYPSANKNTAIKISCDITKTRFISDISFDIDFTHSQYNQNLFDNLKFSYTIAKPSSATTKSYDLEISVADNAKMMFEYKPFEDTICYTHKSNSLGIYQYISTIIPNKTDRIQKITIKIKSNESFVVDLYRTLIYSTHGFVVKDLDIKSQKKDLVELTHDYGFIDIATHTLFGSTVVSFINVKPNNKDYIYYVAENNSVDTNIIPQGIFQRNNSNIKYVSCSQDATHHKVKFNLKNSTYTAYVDKETELNLLYETKDIRDNSSAKFVYQNNLKEMYQFVKQFWSDDDSTDNFWWVDSSHVLELKNEDIVLWEKIVTVVDGVQQNVVDDWMGDKWRIVPETYRKTVKEIVDGTQKEIEKTFEGEKRVSKHNFFSINDIYYNVSSAKDALTGPVLYKLQATHNYTNNTGAIKILYIDDILKCTFNADKILWKEITIDVQTIDYGTKLLTNKITSYVDINPAALLGVADISATVIDKTFMLGIAYNRGLSQWTIKIYDNGTFDIINGYGHVGVNGSLTGGQLPAFACSYNGFNIAVNNLNDIHNLKGLDLNNEPDTAPTVPASACYGTGSTVWFIDKQINAIVSHYEYEPTTGNHRPVELALCSNIERRYESASFQAAGLFDLVSPPISFNTLFEHIINDSTALEIINNMANIILPLLFIIDLKFVMLSYINHTFGQYCYVWRNSNKDYLPEGKTDQDIKFLQDKYTQTFKQSADDNVSDKNMFWVQVILKAIEFADNATVDYVANQAQGQTGRMSSQFFTDNVTNTIGDLLVTDNFNITLKSTLSQAFTLDMFYSIDDKTQCFAGPGFVNHNLTGQCVAQSATDTQVSGKRIGYWVTLKALSAAIVSIKLNIIEAIQTGITNLSNDIGSNPGPSVAGTNAGLGMILSTALNIAAGVLDALIIANKEGLKILEQLADAVGPATGKAYAAGSIQKYNLSIEDTHTYGDKPMSFFWPAFGVSKPIKYTNEYVAAQSESNTQNMSFTGRIHEVFFKPEESWSKAHSNDEFLKGKKLPMDGPIKSVTVKCKGKAVEQIAPEGMAIVEGVKSFLSPELFKNEQIGVSPVVFPTPPIHDYLLDEKWQLGVTAGAGEIIWVSCDDTKLLDGPPSNIVISKDFCGVASSYIAIEIKDTYDHRYLRPWAVTPQAIALNINKMNCIQETKVYHAFDGQGNRIIKWSGGSGMDKAVLYQQYQFQVNDHFKRSNILPPSQFFGIFNGPPSIAMRSISPNENVANIAQSITLQTGVEEDIPGEQKNLTRFSIPVHSKQLSTLPAMVRMLAPYKLHVIEGVTSLTTDIRTTQTRYKAPSSIDFNIYSQAYRATDEFLCELNSVDGIVSVKDICATAGLAFMGATTREAFFFSPATRLYYSFSNGREIQKVDIMNRFIDVYEGKWDYVNQEVMFKALDGKDVIVCRLDRNVLGEVFPPNKTIYSENSDYKLLSMAGGTVFQGPKRFIVNRFIILDYMFDDIIKYNRRKYTPVHPDEFDKKNWRRVSRDFYDQTRDYGWEYADIDNVSTREGLIDYDSIWWAIHGWTHNPKGLVTSMLGIDDNTDCKFEWTMTFAWTSQMELFYKNNEYAVVNVMSETVTQGGTVRCEPTHIFLFKECFTRSGNAGYYTFKFQSNNGIGNRERLFVWSDAIVALQDLRLRCKEMTRNRTQPLHTQVDVKNLIEA